MARDKQATRRKIEVSHIEVSTFCHATEDCSRVDQALKNLFPIEYRDSIKVEYNRREGFYGNPIVVMNCRVEDKTHVEELIKYITTNLSSIEKSIIKATLELRYDPSTKRLVIRFSKQDLFLGSMKILDSDDIVKLVLCFKNVRKMDDLLEYLKNIGLIQ